MVLPFLIPIANMVSQVGNNLSNRYAQIAENEKNRDWQERIYKQYESPQAQAQQMAAAGLNPYAQGAVSSQQVGSASTSALPPGVAPNFDMPLYPSLQKQQMEADIHKTETETAKIWKDNIRADLELDIYKYDVDARLQHLVKDMELLDVYIQQGKIDKAQKQQYLDWLFDVADFGYNPLFSRAELDHINTIIRGLDYTYKLETNESMINYVKEGLRHAYSMNNLTEEAQSLSNQMQQRSFTLTEYRERFYKMFGYDPSVLPPILQGYVFGRLFNRDLRHWKDRDNTEFDEWKAVGSEIQSQCEKLLEASEFVYDPVTTSSNFGFDIFGLGFNTGSSTTKNRR